MLEIVLAILAAFSLAPQMTSASGVERHMAVSSFPRPAAVSRPAPPVKRRVESLGVETTGKAAFVADVATASVLFSKNAHDVLPIASLTKLMTAIVVIDRGYDLDEPITFMSEDFQNDGGKDVFVVGETITRREALSALLVGSVNAAGNVLARTGQTKEEFVKAMNDMAMQMKLASPVFVDPTGLNPENRASAADVAALMSKALSYPEIRTIIALPQVVIKGKTGNAYKIKSTNLLLKSFLNKEPYQILGGKTGSLSEAGYSMAQLTRNADGHEIVAVTLSSDNHFSRYQDVKALTAWAFDTYKWD